MLREVKTNLIRPVLLAYKATPGSGTASFAFGGQYFSSVANSTTSILEADLKVALGRTPIVVGALDAADATAGDAVVVGPAATEILTYGAQSNGAGRAGTHHVLALGFESSDATAYRRHGFHVKIDRDRPEIKGFQVNTAASGTIVIGKFHASISRTGAGDVTLTFNRAFGNDNVAAVATVVGSTAISFRVTATRSSVRVRCTNHGGSVATDCVFNLLVVGSYDSAGAHATRANLQCAQRKPLLMGWKVGVTAGTPSVALGTGASITDNGAGDSTLTYSTAFKREPIVVACGTQLGTHAIRLSTSSASAVRVLTKNAAGANTDTGSGEGYHLIALGFDDATEF